MMRQAQPFVLWIILASAPLTGLTCPVRDQAIEGVEGELSCIGENPRSTTIRKKDGLLVEGTIQHPVVQKGKVNEETGKEGTKFYRVTYFLTNGDQITSVDEKGVHSKWVIMFTATEEGQPPNDDEVLKPGKTGIMNPRKGGKLSVLSFDFGPKIPLNERLIGTLRKKPGAEHDEVIVVPELEILTATGVVRLPIGEIAAFSGDAKQ